ncbi:DUF2244 domain-containing protein [Cohnella kolymensis]|uniref:DUF2244 domain-containing protein n=1 Tax=Cohnella kolymensis TaxID=1590652 RepID=UPI000B087F34|nr:DUF2244 domain-containing protein [Cohnella kolymensis]
MSKRLSLMFAVSSVLLMIATAVSISYNAWLVLLFGILTVANIGLGFVVKARRTK